MANFMCLNWAMVCLDIWLLFRVFPWGCFYIRVAPTLVDWIKQIALPNMGGPRSVSKSLISLNLPQLRGNSYCLISLKMEFCFLSLLLNWNISSSWVLGLPVFQLELQHQLAWVSSFITHSTAIGTSQLLGWAPKNWYFWTVVLEKILESPLDSKEIKPVNPKGNQSWIFIGRTGAEVEAPILWPPDMKSQFIGKDLMLGRIEERKKRGQQRMR